MDKNVFPYNFVPRPYQLEVFKEFFGTKTKRFIEIQHRRAGKDKNWLNMIIAASQIRVGTYIHMLPTLAQARKVVWNGIDKEGKRFFDHIPPHLIEGTPNSTEMFVKFKNGSVVMLGGSDNYNAYMGTNPIHITFSEYSLQNPYAWDYLRPILTENGGSASFLYTPRGNNHGWNIYNANIDNDKWFVRKLTVDDTHDNEGNRIITDEMIEEERRSGMSENMIQQEFYCSFEAAREGAVFALQLKSAEDDKRICKIPIDKSILVDTYWDIGKNDSTAIWFVQYQNNEFRLINYYECRGQEIPHYINYLNDFRDRHNIVYGRHYGPHDIEHERVHCKSFKSIARDLGVIFIMVPRVSKKSIGIEALRSVFSRFYIDRQRCEHGLACLREYHFEQVEKKGIFSSEPVHNWASHGCDALMQLAQWEKLSKNRDKTGVFKNKVGQNSVFR